MQFLLVYIREAHPIDGWVMPENEEAGIKIIDPTSLQARETVAHTACARLNIAFPTVVDNLDNKVGSAYSGWPDRLYVVGKDGKIGFKSAPGPWGFDTIALQHYLEGIDPADAGSTPPGPPTGATAVPAAPAGPVGNGSTPAPPAGARP